MPNSTKDLTHLELFRTKNTHIRSHMKNMTLSLTLGYFCCNIGSCLGKFFDDGPIRDGIENIHVFDTLFSESAKNS